MENRKLVPNAGGCLVSNNILSGYGQLRWAFREKPANKQDNGWRFLSAEDDQAYIDDPRNLSVCDFSTMAEIEPAVIGIYFYPVGSDFQFVVENGRRVFFDNTTQKEVPPKYENE